MVCALLAATGSPTRAFAIIPDAVLHGSWSEASTRHVRVLTDAGNARARHIAERLERLRQQAARTLPALMDDSGRQRLVFVFTDPASFNAYVPTFGGRQDDDAGFFQPGPDRDWLLFADAPDAQLDRIALHEFTHALLRSAAPGAPPWLHEGLAEYFSTLRVDDADVRVGEPMPEAVEWLHGHALMSLGDLLSTSFSSADYHVGDRRGTFYAESWLLVHMLLNESSSDLPRWDRMLRSIRAGEEPRAALRAAFGDEQALGWRLVNYSHRRTLGPMNWGFAQPNGVVTLASRWRVPNAEIAAALGEMLLVQRGSDLAPAQQHADAALALDGDDATAHELASALAARREPPSAGPGTETTTLDIRPGAGGPPAPGALTPAELEHVSELVRGGPPEAARAYLHLLLAQGLPPRQRTSLERLLRALADDAPGH